MAKKATSTRLKRLPKTLPQILVFIDTGHSFVKGLLDNGWDDEGRPSYHTELFPHAMLPLTKTAVERIGARHGAQSPDFLIVNGEGYKVGDMAELDNPTKLRGPVRYTRDYAGVLFASMLSRLLLADEAEVFVWASLPSRDFEHREALAKALKNTWVVDVGGRERVYHVAEVGVYDESTGGLMNVALNESLDVNQDILDSVALVLDIGGGTTGISRTAPGGYVDYSFATGFNLGVLDIMSTLSTLVKEDFDELSEETNIPQFRLEQALRTRRLNIGGRSLDVSDQVHRAIEAYLKDGLYRIFETKAGSRVTYDTVIMTGGGSVLAGPYIRDALGDMHVQYAADEDHIQFANLLGARKMYHLMKEWGD